MKITFSDQVSTLGVSFIGIAKGEHYEWTGLPALEAAQAYLPKQICMSVLDAGGMIQPASAVMSGFNDKYYWNWFLVGKYRPDATDYAINCPDVMAYIPRSGGLLEYSINSEVTPVTVMKGSSYLFGGKTDWVDLTTVGSPGRFSQYPTKKLYVGAEEQYLNSSVAAIFRLTYDIVTLTSQEQIDMLGRTC
jgi:hypothetical protein